MAESTQKAVKPNRRRKAVSPRGRVTAPRKRAAKVRLTPTGPATPTHADIAVRAYYVYLDRGATSGKALDDWLQAEREMYH